MNDDVVAVDAAVAFVVEFTTLSDDEFVSKFIATNYRISEMCLSVCRMFTNRDINLDYFKCWFCRLLTHAMLLQLTPKLMENLYIYLFICFL